MEPERSGVRLKRQDPLRVEPIRNWSTAFKSSRQEGDRPSVAAARARAETVRGGPVDATVAEGVAQGYQVVEDHIRQGRRVAEQLGGPAAESKRSTVDEARDLAEKALRFYGELSSQVVQLLETALTSSGFPGAAAAQRESRQSGTCSPADTDRVGPGARLEIRANVPTQVKVDLQPVTGARLVVQPLRRLSGEDPPIADITVDVADPAGTPVVRLCIAQSQPPGLYTGVVLDQNSGEVAGTVSVRVGEPDVRG